MKELHDCVIHYVYIDFQYNATTMHCSCKFHLPVFPSAYRLVAAWCLRCHGSCKVCCAVLAIMTPGSIMHTGRHYMILKLPNAHVMMAAPAGLVSLAPLCSCMEDYQDMAQWGSCEEDKVSTGIRGWGGFCIILIYSIALRSLSLSLSLSLSPLLSPFLSINVAISPPPFAPSFFLSPLLW